LDEEEDVEVDVVMLPSVALLEGEKVPPVVVESLPLVVAPLPPLDVPFRVVPDEAHPACTTATAQRAPRTRAARRGKAEWKVISPERDTF
jgi:hypothetical protein